MIENHCLFVNFAKSASLACNNKVAEVAVYCVDAALKDFVNRTDPFVTPCLYNNFDNVTTTSSTVNISIGVVNS